LAKVILLAGGGGHTGYAYSLAQHLSKKCELEAFYPQNDELSFKRLSKYAETKSIVLPRGPKTGMVPFVKGLAKSFLQSSKLLKGKYVIVSTGNNFCIPPSLISWTKSNPIVNLEASVRFVGPSKTANILKRFAKITALHWEEQRKIFPNGEVFGPIITEPVVKSHNDGYVLVTGGTYGHSGIMNTGGTYGHSGIMNSLDSLDLENVVVQSGPHNLDKLKEKHPSWNIFAWSDKFHEILAGADVVVTASGSTVLESAIVYKKPTIISYNPEWTRTAKYEDILMLSKKVNGVLLEKFTHNSLMDAIEMARKQKPPEIKSGAGKLSKRILEFAEELR
jgi:UDP-N-acetylglucosamine:LPS N-acetylglucosamine transferase